MDKMLHVGAALINSGGPVGANLERIERQARIAAAIGVEVLLFAECALHGYDYELTAQTLVATAEPLDGASCHALRQIAARYNVNLLVGMFEREGDSFYNTHVAVAPAGLLGAQRKHCLAPVDADAGISAGQRARTVFTFNGVRCAILICADTAIRDRYQLMREHDVHYTFIPTGGGGKIGDYIREADLANEAELAKHTANLPRVFNTDAVNAEARRHGQGFTACNAMGRVGANTCHQGHAMIVDNSGLMRAQHPGTIVLDHQHDTLIHARLAF